MAKYEYDYQNTPQYLNEERADEGTGEFFNKKLQEPLTPRALVNNTLAGENAGENHVNNRWKLSPMNSSPHRMDSAQYMDSSDKSTSPISSLKFARGKQMNTNLDSRLSQGSQIPPTPHSANSLVVQQMSPRENQKADLLPPASIKSPRLGRETTLVSSDMPPDESRTDSVPVVNKGVAPEILKNEKSGANAHYGHSKSHASESPNYHRQMQQQFHRGSIGDWEFIKTIGAGSMGKVKLSRHKTTKELCAVKIVPRAAKLYQRSHASDPPPINAQEAAQKQKEFEKELARDKRTIRESTLGQLLYHPYICRLYETVPMTNHYYLLFEYVEGGQMLDYIVSHGSLSEKLARKFARSIALALDYCHKNSIFHRDLKIENIMMTSSGDIKIIDFGLSNLYSPKTLLKTYCGSLYFAAPELLSAKPYIGPEVDIWSFGVVLFVLVCGRVPFDDKSVSVLHEKIKRGKVEYPHFLSKECISLLQRMLVIDPNRRADMYEISLHPWMVRDYDMPFCNFVPKREPLKLPLSESVVRSIVSYDIGTFESISLELTNIISSVDYQISTDYWYKCKEEGKAYASEQFSHLYPDPTGGFHPLLSIYYMVDEMQRRRRAREESANFYNEQMKQQKKKAHSLMSSLSPPSTTYDKQMQRQPLEQSRNAPVLSLPEQAHAPTMPSAFSKEPPSSTLEQPNLEQPNQISIPEQQPLSPKESFYGDSHETTGKSGFNSLLRRLSSRKYRNAQTGATGRTSEGSTDGDGAEEDALPKVAVTTSTGEKKTLNNSQIPRPNDPMVRRGASMKVTARELSSSHLPGDDAKVNKMAEAPMLPKASNITKATHGRSSSTATNNMQKQALQTQGNELPPLPKLGVDDLRKSTDVPSADENKLHPTARARSLGNHGMRKHVVGSGRAPPTAQLPNILASQNSEDEIRTNESPEQGFLDDIALYDVESSKTSQLTDEQIIDQFNHAKQNSMPSIEYPKTLFLKGFFNVQTTSTKPLPVIRYNIITVLNKLGVKFQEVKGGFICVQSSSTRMRTTQDETEKPFLPDESFADTVEYEKRNTAFDKYKSGDTVSEQISKTDITDANPSNTTPRSPSRQAALRVNTANLSPPSSGGTRSHKHSNSTSTHGRKFSIGNLILGHKKGSGSPVLNPPHTPATAKISQQLFRRDDEEDDEDIDEDEILKSYSDYNSVDSLNGLQAGGGSDMLITSNVDHGTGDQQSLEATQVKTNARRSPMKFELHIVKVPLIGLYGVQLKKLMGNTWTYKSLASQILSQLNL